MRNRSKKWIVYKKSGGIVGMVYKLIIFKNGKYELYDHNKLIKVASLQMNIDKEVKEILKYKNVKVKHTVMDGIYVTLIINGQEIPIDYNARNLPELLKILDNLIEISN